MQISAVLHAEELNEAITAYIIKAGYPVEGMEVDITLTKGRSKGDYATIVFTPEGAEPLVEDEEEEETPEPVVEEVEEETPPFKEEKEPDPKKSLFN